MAEGEVTVDRRRGRRWTAFLDDVALGIAGAILSKPAFAAVVLLGANVAFGVDIFTVGIAFLGGLALSRTDRDLSVRIFAAWVALACATRVVPYEFLLPGHPETIGMPIVLVFTIATTAWSAGGRRIWGIALAAIAAVGVWWGVRSGSSQGLMELGNVGSTAFVVLFVWLGSRGWTTAATVLAGLVATVLATMGGFEGPGLYSVLATAGRVAELFVSILALTVCGMVARAARGSPSRDDGALALTTFARRPWVSALVLGLLLRTGSFVASFWFFGWGSESSGLVVLAGVAVMSAFLALIASSAAGSIALLAPLTAVCVFATIDWSRLNAFSAAAPGAWNQNSDARMLALVCALVLPLFVTWAATRPAFALERFRGFLVAGAVLAPCVAKSAQVTNEIWVLAAWPVLVTLVCASAVADGRPSPHVVAFATLAGLVSGIAFELVTPAVRWVDQAMVAMAPQPAWIDLTATWFLASALVVIARRARSITVVPDDHAIFTEVIPRR